jgi:hypothetical protein
VGVAPKAGAAAAEPKAGVLAAPKAPVNRGRSSRKREGNKRKRKMR